MGPQLPVRQLLRLVRRVAPERDRAEGADPARVRVDRGDRELPPGAQGDRRSGAAARRRQGRVPDVRRGDRGARRGPGPGRRVPARVAPPPDGLQDRDDASGQRGRGAERAERDGPRDRLRGAARPRPRGGPGGRPRRADPVRGLGADDLLHRRGGRLGRSRTPDRGARDQGDEADRAPRARDRGGHHPARHARGPADGRAHGVPRADPLRRRVVRERRVTRAAERDAAPHRPRAHDRDGGASAPGGLPRVLRARLPAGRRDGRDVARRAQPAGHRRLVDHQRDGGGLRRHAVVPVPPARVHGRRLRDRRGRAERALGPDAQPRRVDAVHPQADRGRDRAHHAGAVVGDLEGGGRRRDHLRAPRHRLAHRGRRDRGLLPADRGGRSVPLPRRRPRDHGHAGPVHGRRPRAAGPARGRGSPGIKGQFASEPPGAESPPITEPEPFGFKML